MKEVKIVAIRVDASIVMGTGHVMRCLTLAGSLRSRGVRCHFILRAHEGSMIATIRQQGFDATELPIDQVTDSLVHEADASPLAHASWLGCDWRKDAEQTLRAVLAIQPDMLVIDHYAIDARWEEAIRPYVRRIMVIDDLADRRHECDVLLDQNLGREAEHYSSKVSKTCAVLAGSCYALLRPEFAELRSYSLDRRRHALVKKLLITMGGVDAANVTGRVLAALKNLPLPESCCITVVMGVNAPWLQHVRELAASMPWPTKVWVGVENMAQLMADSDLAVGAAGTTSWERCSLGLPSLIVVLADNQKEIASALHSGGAAYNVGSPFADSFFWNFRRALAECTGAPGKLENLSSCAAKVTDGQGVLRVMSKLGISSEK